MISTVPDREDDGDGGSNVGAAKGKSTPYLRIRLAFERLGGGEKHDLGRSVLFEITTRNRSLPWGYIVKAAPAPEVEETGDAGSIESWAGFCKGHHVTGPCVAETKPLTKGLKLIDCEEKRVVAVGDLEPAADGERQNGDRKSHGIEYVALSYVWGRINAAEAQSSAQEAHSSGHLPPQLLPLFADAVTITKALGFRYLWIDRYCIPGRDATKEEASASERRRQLELMGQIYGQSALTLIVAAGQGVHDGIPGISTPREEQLSLKTETSLFATLLRPDLDVASSKWASRAWTYQEGLLSRRRLVFTPSQIYFQCQALHCHESLSLPLDLAPGLNFGCVFPLASEVLQPSRLKNHIKAYMAKGLGHNDDRLDAFKGILREYSRSNNLAVDHFLGLPLFHPGDFANVKAVSQTDRLAVALGWMPDQAVSSSSQGGLLSSQVVDPYCLLDSPCPFPSWTWLAWRLQQAGRSCNNTPKHTFRFNLADGPASPLADGVSAAPGMEISVGFADGTVCSWEADGHAIAEKAEEADFLRLKTLCFDLTARKAAAASADAALALAQPVAAALGKAAADAIETWVRRCSVPAYDAPAGQEYQLIGALVSGRNWRTGSMTRQPTDSGVAVATALVCARKHWRPGGPLVRLGALSIAYEGLVSAAGQGDGLVMKNIDSGVNEKQNLRVWLRELDIY